MQGHLTPQSTFNLAIILSDSMDSSWQCSKVQCTNHTLTTYQVTLCVHMKPTSISWVWVTNLQEQLLSYSIPQTHDNVKGMLKSLPLTHCLQQHIPAANVMHQ